MPDLEFPYEPVATKDDARPLRDGTIARERVYVFYLGKHGPFTERVPITAAPFDDGEIGRRVVALRIHLRTIQAL